MEGLREKQQYLLSRKCLPCAWEGAVWGSPRVERPWRGQDGGTEAGAAQEEPRGLVMAPRAAPGMGLCSSWAGLGLCPAGMTQLPAPAAAWIRDRIRDRIPMEGQSSGHPCPGRAQGGQEGPGRGEQGCAHPESQPDWQLSRAGKELSALSLGVMQSKWNKSRAVALFVVSGLDQGSAWGGVSASCTS